MYTNLDELKLNINHRCQGEDRITVIKAIDKAQTALKTWSFISTDFLDPFKKILVTDILHEIKGLKYTEFAGHANGTRASLILYSEELSEDMIDYSDIFSIVTVIPVSGSENLTHRDYLGAIMNLGINRDFFGDILINAESCMIVGKKSIIQHINSSLTQVAKYSVSTHITSLSELVVPEEKSKEFTVNISSMRLDCIIGAAFHVSRSEAARLIENGRVFVNYREVKNISKNITEKSVISCKGYGKIELLEILGETKKGRIRIKIKIFG